MEFLDYRNIRNKLNKKGLLHKKPNFDEASAQFYSLARKLDDHKLYAGLCHLAVTHCQNREGQVGAFLNAARAFSQGSHQTVAPEYNFQDVKWMYKEALLICDKSFIGPVYFELGEFFESHGLFQHAAECFMRSQSTTRCVKNYILSHNYEKALEVLNNCPKISLSREDYITKRLLELVVTQLSDMIDVDATKSSPSYCENILSDTEMHDEHDALPVDDVLYNMNGLLKSLIILQKERALKTQRCRKLREIQVTLVDKLSVFLSEIQIQLLYTIISNENGATSERDRKQTTTPAVKCQAGAKHDLKVNMSASADLGPGPGARLVAI